MNRDSRESTPPLQAVSCNACRCVRSTSLVERAIGARWRRVNRENTYAACARAR